MLEKLFEKKDMLEKIDLKSVLLWDIDAFNRKVFVPFDLFDSRVWRWYASSCLLPDESDLYSLINMRQLQILSN